MSTPTPATMQTFVGYPQGLSTPVVQETVMMPTETILMPQTALSTVSRPVTVRTENITAMPTLPTVTVPTQVQTMPSIVREEVVVNPGYGGLEAQVAQLSARNASLELQMQGVLRELAAQKARLDKLDPPETPLRQAVKMIERRGNIRVNHQTGHVQLQRQIQFQPRTTKDEPTAVFRDLDAADAICRDLAEISSLFGCPMTVEGHTKGGESDFWLTLANDRSRVVAEKMIEFGAPAHLLHTQGLPGRMGKNNVCTEVYMDVSNIKDENSQVTERDVVVGGRVVERDLIQSGRVVERDVVKATPVVERDMIVGGRVVERDFYMPGAPEVVAVNGSVVETASVRQPVVRTISASSANPAKVVLSSTSPPAMSRPAVVLANRGISY